MCLLGGKLVRGRRVYDHTSWKIYILPLSSTSKVINKKRILHTLNMTKKIKRIKIKELRRILKHQLLLSRKEDRLYICIERELVRDFLFYLSSVNNTQ